MTLQKNKVFKRIKLSRNSYSIEQKNKLLVMLWKIEEMRLQDFLNLTAAWLVDGLKQVKSEMKKGKVLEKLVLDKRSFILRLKSDCITG